MISYQADLFKLYFLVTSQNLKIARIYQSIDHGTTWQSYSEVDLELDALAISPVNKDIWIAGGSSGEIARSMDAGKTWSVVFDSGRSGQFKDIEFSRSNPNIVITCEEISEKHMMRSNDTGLTWTILPTGDWGWNSSQDMSIHPTDPDIIVAVIQGPPRWSHFIRRTADGGQTWSDFGPEETDFYGVGGAMSVHIDSRIQRSFMPIKSTGMFSGGALMAVSTGS